MAEQQKTMGRPRVKDSKRAIQKTISLRAEEWEALAAADPDGSPTREAQRRLRASLQKTDRRNKMQTLTIDYPTRVSPKTGIYLNPEKYYLSTFENDYIGNCTPVEITNNRIFQFSMPHVIGSTVDDLCKLLDEIAPLVQTICDGYDTDIQDGNLVGIFTNDEARKAYFKLQDIASEFNNSVLYGYYIQEFTKKKDRYICQYEPTEITGFDIDDAKKKTDKIFRNPATKLVLGTGIDSEKGEIPECYIKAIRENGVWQDYKYEFDYTSDDDDGKLVPIHKDTNAE